LQDGSRKKSNMPLLKHGSGQLLPLVITPTAAGKNSSIHIN
jgi:hypothetical protein